MQNVFGWSLGFVHSTSSCMDAIEKLLNKGHNFEVPLFYCANASKERKT